MSEQPNFERVEQFLSAITALHDELKALILTCSPDFHQRMDANPEDFNAAAELQTALAALCREALFVIFGSSKHGVLTRSLNTEAVLRFGKLYEQRVAVDRPERRTEAEIDDAVRRRIRVLDKEILLMSEQEMRQLSGDIKEIPEMLYYLTTMLGQLGWYLERFFIRLTEHPTSGRELPAG